MTTGWRCSSATARNPAGCWRSIESIGLLSADNLRFLQVDRLASLGRWQELAGLPTFRDLARTPASPTDQ